MFREYAVEPAVLSSWDSVRYFLDAFGPWKGRFLARYPKHWLRLVYESLTCGAAEKKKIEIRLEALDRRVFTARKGALYDGARPWIDNASAEHAREPFSAIISSGAGGHAGILDATGIDEHQPLWRIDQGRLIARDSAAFVAAIQLLLRVSKKIVLIDPYFRPDKRDKVGPLTAFCDVLESGTVVEIHARLGEAGDPSHQHFGAQSHAQLPRAITAGIDATLHTWQQRHGGPRLHNRYLLTEIGGVQFGDSVEVGDAGETDRLSILEEKTRAALWNDYAEPAATSFHRVGAAIVIRGTRKR
jgi:hypothetical protein